MEKVSEFAQLVTCFRQERGMSQGQLAHATRLSRTYIYHLETGQRANPSPEVVQNIVRALELASNERQRLFEAYTALTGQFLDQEQIESTLLDMGEIASLLVHNTSYPAHSLDKLWYVPSWNEAAMILFEVQEYVARNDKLHMLDLLFNPQRRRLFLGWENLVRRLVSDFQYNTSRITHLPEYKALWRQLRESPDFRRISSSTYQRGKPSPSFVFRMQHSQLGYITLRTATTVFTGVTNYSMVSYVPGDQQTLAIYRTHGWQFS